MTLNTSVSGMLHHVTRRKLENVENERRRLQKHVGELLQASQRCEQDANERLAVLIDGVKDKELDKELVTSNGKTIDVIRELLIQARYDSSISADRIERWQADLEEGLKKCQKRLDASILFGDLVSEWIQQPDESTVMAADDGTFQHVGRKEMHEQRGTWEEQAFADRKTDADAIVTYLEEVFAEADKPVENGKVSPLQSFRDNIARFTKVAMSELTANTIEECIDGVLEQDLYAGPQRTALLDLKSKPEVLQEMADVLNQDLAMIDEWQWSTDPVMLDMRRHINGKYRVFMNEDVHQAILLHYVGVCWSRFFRAQFKDLLEAVWIDGSEDSLTEEKQVRRKVMVPRPPNGRTVQEIRRQSFKDEFWLSSLAGSMSTGGGTYEDGEYAFNNSQKGTFGGLKQALLRLLTTEMLLQTELYKEFAVVQTDFRWFGPSLPHSTIASVLRFFGVPTEWLTFFEKFMTPRVAFAVDGDNAAVHQRRCGVPMSHELSNALSEPILICLDFAVNKATQGGLLYRMHDDLWIWGQRKRCEKAWESIQRFTQVMGLTLNEEKTGSVVMSSDKGASAMLPKGCIRWGFLTLSGEKRGWEIDTIMLDEHTTELQRQLDDCKSVMAWIRAWNSYTGSFFSANFGRPASCLGKRHAELCMEAFQRVQDRLFGSVNVASHLTGVIQKRFPITAALPHGFFYFPENVGGLSVRNPFIKLNVARNGFRRQAERDEIFTDAWNKTEKDYGSCKEDWEDPLRRHSDVPQKYIDCPFMSKEEFYAHAEEQNRHIGLTYGSLLRGDQVEQEPDEDPYPIRFTYLGYDDYRGSYNSDEQYWNRILELYGDEVVKEYGTLQIAKQRSLPLGVMEVMSSERVRWAS